MKLISLGVCFSLLVAARAEEIVVPGGKIDLQFTAPPPEAERPLIDRWLAMATQAVVTYCGKFPVDVVSLRISPRSGRGVSRGTTYGSPAARITISVGTETTAEGFAEDWMLTHELLHLAFPSLRRPHHWLEEGLSTYVEPIARVRAGFLSAERMWGDVVRDLPQGLPATNDQGLDRTHTWGRTYWGGALFCLRADVEIRRRTDNRLGLEHALRAILAEGGDVRSDWTMDRVIAVGDGATGVPVLRELYDEMSGQPMMVDLPALWKQLGIARTNGVTTFDDQAPLAAIRKAITTPSARAK